MSSPPSPPPPPNQYLSIISQKIIIYFGILIFIMGFIGGILNLIVFLSLKTFRNSSCAFYLIIMSLVNICHLFTGLFTYIMISGFSINWTDMSLFYCKFRPFYVQLCILTSFTCMCLSTIDQFFATCSNPRYHRWNNITLARYLVFTTVIIWILYGIPFILYYNFSLSTITGEYNCIITNIIFQKYTYYFHTPIFISLAPVLLMILFGSLSYRNVQQIAYRTIPLVRRELDKQLTVMVLVEVCFDVIAVTPLILQNICFIIIGTPNDLNTFFTLNFIRNLAISMHNLHFVKSFYIYICVSKRFRQQLIYVLFTVHFNRWFPRRIINNQTDPQT